MISVKVWMFCCATQVEVSVSQPGLYGQFSTGQLRLSSLALRLVPGRLVSAEIHLGARTVLEYLLSPIQKVAIELC